MNTIRCHQGDTLRLAFIAVDAKRKPVQIEPDMEITALLGDMSRKAIEPLSVEIGDQVAQKGLVTISPENGTDLWAPGQYTLQIKVTKAGEVRFDWVRILEVEQVIK